MSQNHVVRLPLSVRYCLRCRRHVNTAKEAFDEIVEHLEYATNGGLIIPTITVFKPKREGETGIRVWNAQLIGYACYQNEDGTLLGDPAKLEFTKVCMSLGWKPPAKRSSFDLLPILISSEGSDRPEMFELPRRVVLEVPLEHPNFPYLKALNMRWYAIPALSDFGIDLGGVYYQSIPFNGWYQITEISRDLLDKQRYDMTEAVAKACNIIPKNSNIWYSPPPAPPPPP